MYSAELSFCNFTSFQPFLSLLTSIYIFFTVFTFPAHPAGFPFCFLNGFLANCIACHQTTSIITSIQSFRMYFFNQGNTLYVNNSVESCSNPRISSHICQKLHMLFSIRYIIARSSSQLQVRRMRYSNFTSTKLSFLHNLIIIFLHHFY